MTVREVALYLRYEDDAGELSAKALAACQKWLTSRGIRPSLNRKLYRRELVEAAVRRAETVGRKSWNSNRKSTPPHLAAASRNLEKAHKANRQRARERRAVQAERNEGE